MSVCWHVLKMNLNEIWFGKHRARQKLTGHELHFSCNLLFTPSSEFLWQNDLNPAILRLQVFLAGDSDFCRFVLIYYYRHMFCHNRTALKVKQCVRDGSRDTI